MKPTIIKDETKNYLKIQDILLPKTEISEKRIEEKKMNRIWSKKKIKIENNFFPEKNINKSFENKKRMKIND